MIKKLVAIAACLTLVCPLFAQKKEDERLADSAKVLKEILSGDKGLPRNVLNQADCVLIFPKVKKMVILGLGTERGRGALVCRKGANMDGAWGAPAMYALDQESLGPQFGSEEMDLVLVVMKQQGANQILNGKIKLGETAAIAVGPTGDQANGFNAAAMKEDVLTYSRSKGIFAGVSLGGTSMDNDDGANKKLYGKERSARDIVTGNEAIPAAAKPLVDLLDKTSPKRK